MSTTLAAVLLAVAGVLAVAAVSYVFYLVGRAEDRERAKAGAPAPAEPEPEPEPPPPDHDHPERNGRIARERRRPMPRRRP
jgi:hypothetical protein